MPSEQNRLRAWVKRYAADNKTVCSFTFCKHYEKPAGLKTFVCILTWRNFGVKNNNYTTMLLKPCNFRIRVTKLHLFQSLEERTENIPILVHILILLRSNIRSRRDARHYAFGIGWAVLYNFFPFWVSPRIMIIIYLTHFVKWCYSLFMAETVFNI